MLSRVAENVYWMARYLERAEDTARLINSTTHLLLDLPRDVEISWDQLIHIIGADQHFPLCYPGGTNENDVMRYLIDDLRNPNCLLACINQARENGRVTREIVPQEVWEQVNELYLYAKATAHETLERKPRFDFLSTVVLRCQTISGVMASTCNQDISYQFLRLGRNLERADMSSRVLDVGAASLLDPAASTSAEFGVVRWMGVLKSLSAHQAFRQQGHIGLRGRDVIAYILRDQLFPRAVGYCLMTAHEALQKMPLNTAPLRELAQLTHDIEQVDVAMLTSQRLHDFIDRLQVALGNVHGAITQTYFRQNLAA
jgi:uncharacterized alpha-E superfamily protein